MDKPVPKKSSVEPTTESTTTAKDTPILEKSSDKWVIGVFSHPVVKSRYSYSLKVGSKVRLNPSPISDDYPNLFGCFSTPQEALEAGLEEVEIE